MLCVVKKSPKRPHHMTGKVDGRRRRQSLARRRLSCLPELRHQLLGWCLGQGHLQPLVALQIEEVEWDQPLCGLPLHDGGHEVAYTAKTEQVLSQRDERQARRSRDELTKVRARVHGQQISRQVQRLQRGAVNKRLRQRCKGQVVDGCVSKERLLDVFAAHPLVHDPHQLRGDLAGLLSRSLFLSRAAGRAAGGCSARSTAHGELLQLPLQAVSFAHHLIFGRDFVVQFPRQRDHLHFHLFQIRGFLPVQLGLPLSDGPLATNLHFQTLFFSLMLLLEAQDLLL
mmetsp:Transcript_22459/g.52894  ORF Transcript_22459/g.52894 Transcript_22459/m.52894 type:complete len:284 (+) Transcript_22459:1227-2078(+)